MPPLLELPLLPDAVLLPARLLPPDAVLLLPRPLVPDAPLPLIWPDDERELPLIPCPDCDPPCPHWPCDPTLEP